MKIRLPVSQWGKSHLQKPEFDRSRYPHAGYAWYVVAILLLAYILAFVDRDVISLLVQPIRADLGISDLQMSFLLGAPLRSSTRSSACRSRGSPTAGIGA